MSGFSEKSPPESGLVSSKNASATDAVCAGFSALCLSYVILIQAHGHCHGLAWPLPSVVLHSSCASAKHSHHLHRQCCSTALSIVTDSGTAEQHVQYVHLLCQRIPTAALQVASLASLTCVICKDIRFASDLGSPYACCCFTPSVPRIILSGTSAGITLACRWLLCEVCHYLILLSVRSLLKNLTAGCLDCIDCLSDHLLNLHHLLTLLDVLHRSCCCIFMLV